MPTKSLPREVRLNPTTLRDGYVNSRMRGRTEVEAVKHTASAYNTNRTVVMEAVAATNAEVAYQAKLLKAITESPQFAPIKQLQQLQEMMVAYDRMVQSAMDLMKATDEDGKPVLSPRDMASCMKTIRSRMEMVDHANKIQDQARQRLIEAPAFTQYDDFFNEAKAELMEEYGDLGPQYRVLVDQLATLLTHQRLIQRSGRAVPLHEHMNLADKVRTLLNQLQRYTESTKQEITSEEANNLARRFLEVVERRTREQPQLFLDIVHDVKQLVGSANEKAVD